MVKRDNGEEIEKDGHIVLERKAIRAVTTAMRFETIVINV